MRGHASRSAAHAPRSLPRLRRVLALIWRTERLQPVEGRPKLYPPTCRRRIRCPALGTGDGRHHHGVRAHRAMFGGRAWIHWSACAKSAHGPCPAPATLAPLGALKPGVDIHGRRRVARRPRRPAGRHAANMGTGRLERLGRPPWLGRRCVHAVVEERLTALRCAAYRLSAWSASLLDRVGAAPQTVARRGADRPTPGRIRTRSASHLGADAWR